MTTIAARAVANCDRSCSLKERLFIRAQIDFQAPCASVLLDEMPVGIGDGIGLEHGIFRRRLVSFAHPPRVDHAIDDDMRHVNAFGSQLGREGLGQAAHGELCAAECNRAGAPAY